MTHAPCFRVKALHSLYTLSPVPSSCKSLPEMEPSGGQELQGRRVWRGGAAEGAHSIPAFFGARPSGAQRPFRSVHSQEFETLL